MGKKPAKKKVVLSLAEFTNDDNAGKAPEIAALPSAPKPAEQWEEEGGRPGYNSRGYKERTNSRRYDDSKRDDDDFNQRSWERTGPIDNDHGSRGGREQAELDWDGVRKGPLDADDGTKERDWEGVRRGPIDAEPAADGASERRWDNMRRQTVEPIEPEVNERNLDFSAARRTPVETDAALNVDDIDFRLRKGPVEAQFSSEERDLDFTNRRGPVDMEPAKPDEVERDFADIRQMAAGVEALSEHRENDVDFGSLRSNQTVIEARPSREADAGRDFSDIRHAQSQMGPIEPCWSSNKTAASDVDWNVRKGPIDATVKPAEKVAVKRRGVLQRNSDDEQTETIGDMSSTSNPPDSRFPVNGETHSKNYKQDQSQSAESAKDMDWGRLRTESRPVQTTGHDTVSWRDTSKSTVVTADSELEALENHASDVARSSVTAPEEGSNGEDDGAWTTVKSTTHSRRGSSRGAHTSRGRPPFARREGPSRDRGPRDRGLVRQTQ